jgi:sortase A
MIPWNDRHYVETLFARTLGNFLVLSSLFMIGKTLYQPAIEEIRFFVNDITRTSYTVEDQTEESVPPEAAPESGGFARLFQQRKVEVMVPADPAFSVVIPKIGANAPVVANVNPGDEPAYLEALKRGIAHAEGTTFPGDGSHIFLFAHSTDYIWNIGSYNAVFYLLYKLENGDEVNLFYNGQRYVYAVKEKTIIEPSQVEYLTRKTDVETLTLQTCWPPGTTLKRLVVTAERKAE